MNQIVETDSINSQRLQEFTINTDNRISLNEVWEYVLREKALPDSLDLEILLTNVQERLRNGEWEIRQHALRLLTDLIPILDKDLIDYNLTVILEDVVVNLGHVSPAIKKGAVDCLNTYVNYITRPNEFIKKLIHNGIENAQENKVQKNVVLGIILALPFLISSRISNDIIQYVVNTLLDRVVYITSQETVVRALARIRHIIGENSFERYRKSHESVNTSTDFNLLCKAYDIDAKDMEVCSNTKPVIYNDENQNILDQFGKWNSNPDDEGRFPFNLEEDRVILETEIKLDSGSAITMKIHEESRQNSINNTDSEDDRPHLMSTFKVLPDDTDYDNYEHLRRTPRRVRFGGEIVKLRTPDSDSNLQSDDDPNRNGTGKPLIEIHYVENETTTTRTSRIPIPVRHHRRNDVQSAPSSPMRDATVHKRKLYKSSPNLSKSKRTSRIPRRFKTETKQTVERNIKIKIQQNGHGHGRRASKDLENTIRTVSYLDKPKENMRPKKKSARSSYPIQEISLPSLNNSSSFEETFPVKEIQNATTELPSIPGTTPRPRRNSREDEFSPIPIHNEIEVIHNLTRSPSPNVAEFEYPSLERKIATPEKSLGDIASTQLTDITGTSDFNSFHIYHSSGSKTFNEMIDSPIPTKDSGECLTCSSSGSDSVAADATKLDTIGLLDKRIVEDIQCIDDVRLRQRGLEELMRFLQTPGVSHSLEERLSTLLHILFTAEQQSILQPTAEQALIVLFSSMKPEALTLRLQQIALGLSKIGSPAGVRLALVLMKHISPKSLMDQLLSENILGAKSSKVREGSLQILMTICRIFPSTETNLPKCLNGAVNALADKKRRVRQAALETVASLAQLSSATNILDIVAKCVEDQNDREQIMRVVRNRLARKQLPMVNLNGNIRYSTQLSETEFEWLQKGSSSTSPQTESEILSTRKTSSNNWRKENATDNNPVAISEIPVVPRAFTTSKEMPLEDRQRLSGQWGSGSNNRRFKSFSTEHLAGSGTATAGRKISSSYEEYMDSSDKPNFWRYNSRKMVEVQRDDLESDWSRSSKEEPIGRTSNTQIWAIDPSIFGAADKVSAGNGTLRPVYLVKSKDPPNRATAAKYSRATNTQSSSGSYTSQRGRSFSPPSASSRKQRYSSYEPHQQYHNNTQPQSQPERFVRTSESGNHQYNNTHPPYSIREDNFRKSYSNDHLNVLERRGGKLVNNENVASSGSSNGSSQRYPGSWSKDVRSGIPVPTGENLRIRRNTGGTKGPLTVSYYRDKAPSSLQQDNTINETYATSASTHQRVISRQPYSSGSDSSGYFTPPAESHHHPPQLEPEPEPDLNPPPPPIERFITTLVASNNKTDEELVTSAEESTTEDQPVTRTDEDDEDDIAILDVETTFDKLEIYEHEESKENTDNEQDEEMVKSKESLYGEEEEERGFATRSHGLLANDIGSFDEIDFSAPGRSPLSEPLSKSEVDIAGRCITEAARKSVSSAPALNDFDEMPIKVALPGAILDEPVTPRNVEICETIEIKPPKSTPAKSTSIPVATAAPPASAGGQLTRRKSTRATPRRVEPSGLPDTMRPFSKPREAYAEVIAQLESPEWEVTVKGLQGMVRMIRYHRETVEGQMHQVALLVGKHVRNLRSQVSRAACLVAGEIFSNCRRGLETTLEDFVTPLLHRTADTNKFLRTDANAALDTMAVNVSVPKLVHVLAHARGTGHQNAVVRCTAVRLMCGLVHRLGAEKVFQLPRETRDKILVTGANMLMEGSLESRKHAKVMLSLLSTHNHFQKSLTDAVPANILRHIEKTIKMIA